MPADTGAPFNFPFPEDADAPDGPAQIEALAQRIHDLLAGGGALHGKVADVAAEQSTSSGSYVELGTPDRVTGLVVPTDALIVCAYNANWKSSAASAGRASLFLDPSGGAATEVQAQNGDNQDDVEARSNGTNLYNHLTTASYGLETEPKSGAYTGDVTTGQVISGDFLSGGVGAGGFCVMFAAAETYDLSVRFRATSGSVTVKNRKLWAFVLPFEAE